MACICVNILLCLFDVKHNCLTYLIELTKLGKEGHNRFPIRFLKNIEHDPKMTHLSFRKGPLKTIVELRVYFHYLFIMITLSVSFEKNSVKTVR